MTGGPIAIVAGATGLVGTALVDQLLASDRFGGVLSLGRRKTGRTHPALREEVIDFDAPETWAGLVRGDVLFSCLGTTLKAAGSKEAQYLVDYTYQLHVAKNAAAGGVPVYVLISSASASPSSPVFYSRMKGELERDTGTLGFSRTRVLRPGPLDGSREEHRRGEKLALAVLRPLSGILPAPLTPVHASIVARAAIQAALDPEPGAKIYAPADILRVGKES